MRRALFSVLLASVAIASLWWPGAGRRSGSSWSPEQRAVLESLWIGSLGPVPPDPSNRVADDPRAVALGHRLFFDRRLSVNNQVSCATCHDPERFFTDGRTRGKAIGEVSRNTRSIVGSAYSPWLFWDGRKDSLWAQALDPLEHPSEHGGTRGFYFQVIAEHYAEDYAALFGPLPDLSDRQRFPLGAGPRGGDEAFARWQSMTSEDRDQVTTVFVNVAKALAAYERRILPGPAPFDSYVEALEQGDEAAMEKALAADQVAGLRLFLGRATCLQCHHGPLFSNNDFHNVGAPGVDGLGPFNGRIEAVQEVHFDPFNCLGPWSEAEGDCPELRFVKMSGEELFGAVRTPSLRNVAETAPYMSFGQLPSLGAVLEHYNRAEDHAPVGHSDLLPLQLTEEELSQLEAFLHSLTGPLRAPEGLLLPPA